MGDRDDEEAVAGIGDTGKSVVPSGEGGEETKEATSLQDLGIGLAVRGEQVGDTQKQEGQVQEEEQKEERDCRLQGADDQDKGEDEPALFRVSREIATGDNWHQGESLPSGTDRTKH